MVYTKRKTQLVGSCTVMALSSGTLAYRGGGGRRSFAPRPHLGHFVKDFTKRVHLIFASPLLSFFVRPCSSDHLYPPYEHHFIIKQRIREHLQIICVLTLEVILFLMIVGVISLAYWLHPSDASLVARQILLIIGTMGLTFGKHKEFWHVQTREQIDSESR